MVRRRTNLNREWRFVRADAPGAEAVDFDDSGWERVGLPHTFDLPYFRTPEFYVGYGWYRRTFEIQGEPGRPRPERFFLKFDGVFQVAEVFVNGKHVGEHRGGYTGFSLDITAAARPGENILAVRVNNLWNPQLAPRAGEHIFCGGIYRDVHLLRTHALHFAWHGTVITTPAVSNDSATISVQTELDSDTTTASHRVRSSIIDPQGRVIATGDDSTFNAVIAHPQLWHPDYPHRYHLNQELLIDDTIVDSITTDFGIRHFEWTADRGFFLNGEHLYLRGANVHQDHAGWGIGITQAAIERDVRLMKEAGFNFIRGAHYPHHPAFADACDRLGTLLWPENCFWGKGGFGPEGYWNASAYPVNAEDFEPFAESCKQSLTELIRTHRNHPSIIAWSMTNEAFFTYHLDRAKGLISELVALSHELDPTRPAAIGGAQRGDIDKLGDIAGYNGDGARLFIDPGVPNMVSEYGAISKPHDKFEPFFGELQSEEYPWRSGQAIWAGFDYGSIAGRQGLKGIVDHFRVPKQSWHWYRKAYRGIEPPALPNANPPAALQLSSDRLEIRGTDAIEDAQIVVTIVDAAGERVSASPPVTLTIESGPGEFPTGSSITFDASTDIKIAEGQAGIALRSYFGGETLIRATSPGLRDATITITTTGEPRFTAGVTPPVPSRPYTPPPVSHAALAAMRNAVDVALNRPSRASSEAELHPARFANDGSSNHWLAQSNSVGEWWQVDLEGFYEVSTVKLAFATEGNYRFVIDRSTEGVEWTRAIDRRETINSASKREDVFPPGTIARHVRLTFHAIPAGQRANLADLKLFGILSVR